MPSAFATNFQAGMAPSLLDTHGEEVVYTPRGGTPRSIMAVVHRQPNQSLPNGAGLAPMATVLVIDQALAISDDGYGGIAASTFSTGDTITFSVRPGEAATARPLHRPQDGNWYEGGMLRLEVR